MKKYITFFFATLALDYSSGQNFVNPSLESWGVSTVCETNSPPNGWTNYSNVGLGPDEANSSLCPSTIPPLAAAGLIYARCLAGNPTTGEGMYQNVSGLTVGNTYTIIYDYCGSNRWGGNGDCQWHLFLNDVDVNQSAVFSSADSVWSRNYYTFNATLTTHKIGFRAYTPTFNGGGSAAIDNFELARGAVTGIQHASFEKSASLYPNPFINFIEVKTDDHEQSQIIIYDMLSRTILQQSFTGATTLNTEQLVSGIYIFEVRNKNGTTMTGKVVKQ
jgi:hypothetical protein